MVRKLLLGVLMLAEVLLSAGRSFAAEPLASFDVVLVKPSGTKPGMRIQFTADGFTAQNVTFRMLVQEAYGVFEDDRLSGIPAQLRSQLYEVEAKVNGGELKEFQALPIAAKRQMLQALLADRFQLHVRHEMKQLPVYWLTVAKSGARLHDAPTNHLHRDPIYGEDGWATKGGPGFMTLEGSSMHSFAAYLTILFNQTVLDATGLTGRYDMSLEWDPTTQPGAYRGRGALDQGSSADPLGRPSIFTAIEEQLGLKLAAGKGPVAVLVVEHAVRPSAD